MKNTKKRVGIRWGRPEDSAGAMAEVRRRWCVAPTGLMGCGATVRSATVVVMS